MPLEKNSAKVTSDARAQISITTVSSSENMLKAPRLARHAASVGRSRTGDSPACSRRLMSYRPVHRNGPTSRNPAVSADVYSYAWRNTNQINQPISAKAAP